MFNIFKSKEIKEIEEKYNIFLELEKSALKTEDKDILAIIESDMANTALLLKLLAKNNKENTEILTKLILKKGIPSCREFTDFSGIIKKSELYNMDPDDLVEIKTIFNKYKEKINTLQKLISLKQHLRGTNKINVFFSVEEVLLEAEKYFSNEKIIKIKKDILKIKKEFENKIFEISNTEVYFKDDILDKIDQLFYKQIEIKELLKISDKELSKINIFLLKEYTYLPIINEN